MENRIYFEVLGVLLVLFLATALLVQVGMVLRRGKQAGEGKDEGIGVVDGAIFGLMGLLLAFAFSTAASRFNERRALIVQEANIIKTAYLRLDLVSEASRPLLQEKVRDYLDSRIDTYINFRDREKVRADEARSTVLQQEIWDLAIRASEEAPSTTTGMLLLPALNDMINIRTARQSATLMHPPVQVSLLLLLVMVVCSILAGSRIKTSDRTPALHRIAFVVVLAITYYAIMDLEYPRIGFVRVDDFDQFLIDLRVLLHQGGAE